MKKYLFDNVEKIQIEVRIEAIGICGLGLMTTNSRTKQKIL